MKENGYDLYSLMVSIWKEMKLDRINESLKSSYSEVKRLSAELDHAKNEGFAALAENELSKKVQYLTEALNNETEKNKQLEAALKNNTNGGNKMAELTQWEYKKISGRSLSEEELNQLGEKGWEIAGSTSAGPLILKRPKQKNQQNSSASYDYGYSR